MTELRTIRQGGEIAFYKICAGFTPTIWELAWLVIGIILGGFKGSASVVNLCWLRCETLLLAVKQKRVVNLYVPMVLSVLVAFLTFSIALKTRFKNILGSFAAYYRAEHPIILLRAEVK